MDVDPGRAQEGGAGRAADLDRGEGALGRDRTTDLQASERSGSGPGPEPTRSPVSRQSASCWLSGARSTDQRSSGRIFAAGALDQATEAAGLSITGSRRTGHGP